MKEIRTRMAPSPTGEYHIGHIRTVLYNYAFARKHGGKFIIRIEDTDRERYVEGATERILEVITKYGLSWDEGPLIEGEYGPYVQSQRLSLYKRYAEDLVSEGCAYYCFCTKQRLDELRERQRKEGMPRTMYDGACREMPREKIEEELNKGTPYVIRLKVPKNMTISFEDVTYGRLDFDSNEIDDAVLLKSDGYPTYHLGVVVDDHLMKITHVLRGNDWLPSTPKHIILYNSFGWKIPIYAHLPNLKEKGENRKLSKRFGSVFASDFLAEGYLPEALLNFLMLLGWNPGTEREVFSLEEFTEVFDLQKIHKTDLVAFDREKLLWVNGLYIRNMPVEKLMDKIISWAEDYEVDLNFLSQRVDYNHKVLKLVQERMKKLSEFTSLVHYFYQAPKPDSVLLASFTSNRQRALEILAGFFEVLSEVKHEEWSCVNLERICHEFIEHKGYKTKESFMTLRIGITGESATPPIFDILEVIGKEETISRFAGLNIHAN